MATGHRVLVFDIETAPLLAYAWSARTKYLGHHLIQRETYLLSWAAKWHGEDGLESAVVTPTEARAQRDDRLVLSLAGLIREADAVVAHNVDRFDVPMLRNRLLLAGHEPLGPVRTIDTVKLARRSSGLASNSLDYLARMLGEEVKHQTTFELWADCIHGDRQALAQMLAYNEQDVRVLERVYDRLRPYVSGLPRLVDADEAQERVCPSCGAEELKRRGYYRTNASTFQRFRCEGCGRWCRARKSDPEKKLSTHPL